MPHVASIHRPVAASLLAIAAVTAASVGDPQIATDHPQMRGELSCSTFERLEATAFAQFKQRYGHAPATAVERVIAHWAWRTEHHQHADADNIPYGKGTKKALSYSDPEGRDFCRDGLLGLFGFSTGLCYSIHAQFTPFIQRTLGDYLAASCTLIPGHTSFEAYADGAWRLADITCGHMVFDKGQPIGILAIIANRSRLAELDGGFLKLKLGPFGDPVSGYNAVKEPEGEGRQMMFGYLGMPMVYSLRAGETFTRWRLPDGGDGVEAIWSKDYFEQAAGHPKHHGMARRETFMGFGAVGEGNIGRMGVKKPPLVYSAKGAFDYLPDLKSVDAETLMSWNATPTIAVSGGKIVAKGGEGSFVLAHAAPYPVAAHQADNAAAPWNVFKNPCDKTATLSITGSAGVRMQLSLDAGQNWTDLGAAGTPLDYTDQVKGRFSYLVRVVVPDAGEVSAISQRTVVQVGPAVFPRLKDEGSTITYQAGNLGVIHGGPDHRMAKAFRFPELDADGWTTYRIQAPGAIRSLHGVSMAVGRKEMSVETSLDGKTWDVAMAPVTMDRAGTARNCSIWGNGTNAIMWGDRRYPDGTAATGYIRLKNAEETATQVYATFDNPGTAAGLAVLVEWDDAGGAGRKANTTFKPGKAEQTWTVPTGKDTVTNAITFAPVAP